jgi:hypothetical protein
MKPVRVEIGSLVVHQPANANLPQHANLGHMVEVHLQQLISERGAPTHSRQAGAVRINASEANARANLAAAVARELYRSIRGKA